MSEDWVIGFKRRLPWYLPEDLRHFRKVTIDQTVIMGRKTFDSIGKPLPRRRNIVISRRRTSFPEGIELARSLREALARCSDQQRVYVIGGGEIFLEALPLADRIHLTLVYVDNPQRTLFGPNPIWGDAHFPAINPAEWRRTKLGPRRVPLGRSRRRLKGVYYRFIDLERVVAAKTTRAEPATDIFHWSMFPAKRRTRREGDVLKTRVKRRRREPELSQTG